MIDRRPTFHSGLCDLKRRSKALFFMGMRPRRPLLQWDRQHGSSQIAFCKSRFFKVLSLRHSVLQEEPRPFSRPLETCLHSLNMELAQGLNETYKALCLQISSYIQKPIFPPARIPRPWSNTIPPRTVLQRTLRRGSCPAWTLCQNIVDLGDTAGGAHITVPLASSMNCTSGGAETILKAA